MRALKSHANAGIKHVENLPVKAFRQGELVALRDDRIERVRDGVGDFDCGAVVGVERPAARSDKWKSVSMGPLATQR